VNSKNEPNWFQPVFYFELFHSIQWGQLPFDLN
jgi:hypothetical protein